MVIYIAGFSFLLIFGLATQLLPKYGQLVKVYCITAWLLLTAAAAFRWSVGLDYNQYYNTFYDISNAADWNEVFSFRYEPGYLIFTRLVTYFTRNIIVYLFLFYGLMYALLMRYVYKYAEIKWLAVIAFLSLDYFAMSFCFMRQGMAMVIGLYAYEMIKQRKSYWVVLLTLLAAMFHVSALMLLLCLFVSYIDVNQKKLFRLYVIFSLIICFGCDYILQHIFVGPFAKYADYLQSRFMKGNNILVVYYPILLFVFVVLFYKKICDSDKTFSAMFPILFLGAVLCVMSTKHYLLERMALYVTIYNIRVIPQIVSIVKAKMSKSVVCLALYGMLVLNIGAYAYGLMIDRYGIVPYRWNEMYMHKVAFFDLSGK